MEFVNAITVAAATFVTWLTIGAAAIGVVAIVVVGIAQLLGTEARVMGR